MTAQTSLQTLPPHILDTIVKYTFSAIEDYSRSKDTLSLFFMHSSRALRMAFLANACREVYIGKEKCKFANHLYSGQFKCFQPPVYMYAYLVKTVNVEFFHHKLDYSKFYDAISELSKPEYENTLFTSARTLDIKVDIEYSGYPSSETEEEEEEWYNEYADEIKNE
ncbi:hypothetical protein J3B02_004789 [Coemansia erecta]|nr:hypothetical protein J3B02_004789 [Coemansia erecta]